MANGKRPRQIDVAKRAGVSRSTVSLVLNNTKSRVQISEETRRRVLQAAQALGYTPNPVAQMLARGRTRIIGVFPIEGRFPYTMADFYYPYLVGVEREAAEQDYNVLLFTRHQAATMAGLFDSGEHSLGLADGLILAGSYPDPALLQRLQDEGYPFVLIGRNSLHDGQIDTVVNDHTPSSYEATRHLLDLNHRRLGIVVNDLSLPFHQERLTGCRQAVDEVTDAQLTILNSDSLRDAATFADALQQHAISALIFADRKLVMPTVDLIQTLPLQIPRELSLLFLVSNPLNLPYPNPTRVSLNRGEKGRMAVQRLVARLGGSADGFTQINVPCRFVVGETTTSALNL